MYNNYFLNFSVPTIASNSTFNLNNKNNLLLDSKINGSPNFISFSDYVAKYGRDNIIKGFKEVEKSYLSKNSTTSSSIESETEKSSLFSRLETGRFFDMEIIGISDLPPNDSSLRVKLNNPNSHYISPIKKSKIFDNKNNNTNTIKSNNSIASANNTFYNNDTAFPYSPYSVSYSDNFPGYTVPTEPKAGAYYYKYSYAYAGNYSCNTSINFNGSNTNDYTTIRYKGVENSAYVYLSAGTNMASIDYGFIASSKNLTGIYAGLYTVHNYVDYYNRSNDDYTLSAYPLIPAYSRTVNFDGSVDLVIQGSATLNIAVANGYVAMYATTSGNSDYRTKSTNLIHFNHDNGLANYPLTFVQAMSFVQSDFGQTSLNSGSFFRNVTLKDPILYAIYNPTIKNFSFFGSHTYYSLLYNHNNISNIRSSDNTKEYISINY